MDGREYKTARRLLRLDEIIGRPEITPEQALANAEANRRAEAQALREGRVDAAGKPKFKRLPVRARAGRPGRIPVSKSSWWAGVRAGKFPAPVKLSAGVSAWLEDQVDAIGAPAPAAPVPSDPSPVRPARAVGRSTSGAAA